MGYGEGLGTSGRQKKGYNVGGIGSLLKEGDFC